MVRSGAATILPDVGADVPEGEDCTLGRGEAIASLAAVGAGAKGVVTLSSIPDPLPIIAMTPAVPAPRADHVIDLDGVIEGMTYHGLARASGLSRSHLTGVLKGKRECTVGYAQKIAEALGVSVTDLLDYVHAKKMALVQEGNGKPGPGRGPRRRPGRQRKRGR